MNLKLLPGEQDAWSELQPGSEVLHMLPSGPYEFILGEGPGIGLYPSCSLYSPMFGFPDQQSTEATAEAVVRGIMEAENRNGLSRCESEIARSWQGNDEQKAGSGSVDRNSATEVKSLAQRLDQPKGYTVRTDPRRFRSLMVRSRGEGEVCTKCRCANPFSR